MYRKLTQPIARWGKGLHSGRHYGLSIEPSDEALSLEAGGERLPLSQLALEGTRRGSDLIFPSGRRVRTCEHVLSALAGSGVWQAKLSVTGSDAESGMGIKTETGMEIKTEMGIEMEMPGLDGCAAGLAAEIAEKSIVAGPADADKMPQPLKLQYPVYIGDSSRFVIALPSPFFCITYVIRYDAPIGTQIFSYGHSRQEANQGEMDSLGYPAGSYLQEIAPARTFAMQSDVEALRASGLALGGSLDNAILVGETRVEATGGLRFPDEFVRHKALDLLGDLANLGRPLIAHVVAVRGGHAQHLQLVERLRAVSRTV